MTVAGCSYTVAYYWQQKLGLPASVLICIGMLPKPVEDRVYQLSILLEVVANHPTFCPLPDSFRNASRSPGPRLLLRLFLVPALLCAANPVISAFSAARFSLLPMVSDVGICEIDLRDRERTRAPLGL